MYLRRVFLPRRIYSVATVSRLSRLVALFLGVLLPGSVSAQAIDNSGTEFFIGFMPNWGEPPPVKAELHLTSDVATDVTVQYPALAPTFTTTVAVNPGAITILDLGLAPTSAWTPGAVDSNAVHVFSEAAFVAYAVNRQDSSTDATVALPVDALGTEYVVHSYPQHYSHGSFAVVAPYDATTVTITPTQALVGGHPAGVPFAITLDRGEAFLGLTLGDSLTAPEADLTGTLIEADRPVQLSNGHTCASVPEPTNSCDHLFEVAHPVRWWGREALAAPLPLRPHGSFYRVLAAQDGTTVQQNGTTVATLGRGELFETPATLGAQAFSGDRPILVTQIATSVGFPVPQIATSGGSPPEALVDVIGDPSMVTALSSAQYLSRYTFSTVGGDQFGEDFVSIIAQDADIAGGTLLLDGAPVLAADFTSIPGTDYSYAVLSLAEGTHTTSSEGVHGITVEGFDIFDSYVYAGGVTFADSTTTSIAAEAPAGFSLEAIYPNPFTDRSTIVYRLARPATVTLEILDLLGRRIAVLERRVAEAGTHRHVWASQTGRLVSGVYVLRLTATPLDGGSPVRLQRSLTRLD